VRAVFLMKTAGVKPCDVFFSKIYITNATCFNF
jgi:hypothetical protein